MTTSSSASPVTTIPEGIVRLVARLGAEPQVRRVILFGSRGRGDHRPRADVDLAVEAPQASARDWLRLREMAEDNPLAIDGTIQRFELAIGRCDRNETSHTHNEKTARRVYASIRSHLPELERTYDGLRARFPA